MLLRAFLDAHNVSVDRLARDSGEHTHLLSSPERAQTVRLSEELVQGALCAWQRDLSSLASVRKAFVEVLTDPFRFFLTIHLPEGGVASYRELMEPLRTTLMEFVPDSRESVSLCHVGVSEDGRMVRLVWPNLLVNNLQALAMRERLVAHLSEMESTPDNVNEYRWHDLIDFGRYSDGVELPGSPIFSTCRHCDNLRQRRASCKYCDFEGVVVLPHRILPFETHSAGGRVEPLTEVVALSVRVPSSTRSPIAGWRRPAGTPHTAIDTPARGAPRIYPSGLHDYGGPAAAGPARRRFTPQMPAGIIKLLERSIRVTHPSDHSRVIVTSRSVLHKVTSRHECYLVSPVGVGSHTCCKFRGEHSDCRVYFCISAKGVEQGCASHERLPSGQECGERKSMPVTLPSRLRDALFPGAARNINPVVTIGGANTPGMHIASRIFEHHSCKLRIKSGKRRRNIHGD